MKDLHIQIPGKSFLVGEYAVLEGQGGILFSHQPYYEFTDDAKMLADGKLNFSFHPRSPAGLFLEKNEIQNTLLMKENYSQKGFGSSTAEFLAVYLQANFQKIKSVLGKEGKLDLPEEMKFEIHRDYLDFFKENKPSGYDLLAQMSSGFNYIHSNKKRIISFEWVFADYAFYFIPTGFKISTHEHLKSIQQIQTSIFHRLVESALVAFQNRQPELFLQSIRGYQEELDRQQLTHPQSREFLASLLKLDGVVAGKGCGALGADVVFLVVKKENQSSFEQHLGQKKISFYQRSSTGIILNERLL